MPDRPYTWTRIQEDFKQEVAHQLLTLAMKNHIDRLLLFGDHNAIAQHHLQGIRGRWPDDYVSPFDDIVSHSEAYLRTLSSQARYLGGDFDEEKSNDS